MEQHSSHLNWQALYSKQLACPVCRAGGRERTPTPHSRQYPSLSHPLLHLSALLRMLVIALPISPCSTSACKALYLRCPFRASTASRFSPPTAPRMLGRPDMCHQRGRPSAGGIREAGSLPVRLPCCLSLAFFFFFWTGLERRACNPMEGEAFLGPR
jgi:hypothetical protein